MSSSAASTLAPPAGRVRVSYLWALGGQLASQGLLTGMSIWVARLLQPQDYGLWAMAGVFTAFCRSLQDMGLESALVQKRELNEKTLSSVFWLLLGGGLVATAAVWMIAPVAAWLYHDARVVPIMRAFAVVLLLIAVRIVPFAVLARQLEFSKRTKAEFWSAVGAALVTLGMATKGYGVWSLLAGALASEVFLNLLLYWYCTWRPAVQFEFAAVKPLLRFGASVTGSGLLWQWYVQADTLVIGYMLGPAALGFYSMAQKLAMLVPEKIASVMNKVNFPVFSSLQERPAAAGQHWIRLTEVISWLCAPTLVGLMLLGENFVAVALTPKWLPIVPALRVLCMVAFLRTFGVILPQLITALGHPGKILTYNIVCAILLPACFIIGAWWGNFTGVALGCLFGYAATLAWMFRQARALTGVRTAAYLHALAPPLAATAVMAVAVFMVTPWGHAANIAGVFRSVLIGVLAYGASALFLMWKTGKLSWYLGLLRPASTNSSVGMSVAIENVPVDMVQTAKG